MTIRSNKRYSPCLAHRATFELLESRELLDSSGLLDEVRAAWSDFDIAGDVKVLEVPATDLSAIKLQACLDEAMGKQDDCLIVLHTTQEYHSISLTAGDEFEIDMTGKGTLTIVSLGALPLTINANNSTRIFNVRGGTCQVGGLTLTGGYANTNSTGDRFQYGCGGACVNSGTLLLSNVTIENCSAGGIFDETGNYSSSFSKGGGIYNAGTLYVFDSVLSGNTALSSGCNSLKGTAYGEGGAVYNDGGTVIVRDTRFLGNEAQAGLAPYEVLEGNTIQTRYTRQEGVGGAIYSSQGTISISGGSFVQNSAWSGGAMVADKSVLACSSSVLFDHNSAGRRGGALLVQGQNTSYTAASFDRCEFRGNIAKDCGGALAVCTALVVTNSMMSGNDAGVNGGALYCFGSSSTKVDLFAIEVTNCTITGNRSGTVSAGLGGGLYFSGTENSNAFAERNRSRSEYENWDNQE